MFRHRLAPEADYYRLPEPPVPKPRPGGFALCTVAGLPGMTVGQWAGVQQLYHAAYEAAQVALRPSLLDRDLFFWN